LTPSQAWVAAALFAVHPVHTEAVAIAVDQGELVVALCAALTVVVWLRWRRGALRDGPAYGALLAAYLTALGFKENGLIIPALLVATELTLPGPATVEARRRWTALGALALVGAAWWSVRAAVLGGVAGAAPAEGLRGVGAVGRGFTMLGVVPEWARLLVWPAHLQGDYSPWEVTPYAGWTAAQTLGLLIAAAFVVASVIAWRRHRGAAFALAWVALALAPVSNVVIPTGILLAERTLFLASAGVAIAVAALIPDRAWQGRWRPVVAGAVGLLLVAGAARSFTRMAIYRDLDSSVEALGRDAPRSWRTMMILGIRRMETGHREEGERLLAAAHAAWPAATRPIQLLAFYQRLDGRCDAAVPWLEESLRLEPTDTWTRLPYVACLRDLGRYADAGVAARAGAGTDVNGLALAQAAVVADSALAARAPAHTVRLPPIRGGLTLVGTRQ
ncbi:MAG TPA: hypothetical protein VG940_05645, partial [Gemmatimonadales bacterium]|nr:hypothetical protein [Gemmatimonadales bacterium]